MRAILIIAVDNPDDTRVVIVSEQRAPALVDELTTANTAGDYRIRNLIADDIDVVLARIRETADA